MCWGLGGGSFEIFGGGVPTGFPDPNPLSEQSNAIISISVCVSEAVSVELYHIERYMFQFFFLSFFFV